MLATLQGVEAVKAVLDATPETQTPFIAINENKIVRKPLMQAVAETKEVAKAVDEKNFEKAMGLRDSEFSDQWNSYLLTTNVMVDDNKLPERDVRFLNHFNFKADLLAHENWLHQCRCSCWWHERCCASRCRLLSFQRP